MSDTPLSISLESARRLSVTKQHLAGNWPGGPAKETILTVIRDLCYVQWDPISIVAPSHVITLWSRIRNFRPSDLDRLLWDERKLFEHWTHAASIALTEDYPLYRSLMQRYPESLSKSWGGWRSRARKFLAEHAELRTTILRELKKGPLQLSQFENYVRTKRSEDGWSTGSDVSAMLFHLQMRGEVMIVGHDGNRNIWGLSEEFLPNWVEQKALSADKAEREGAQRTIRALGTASPSEINLYFLRGRYLTLKAVLRRLQEESIIHRVHVAGLGARDERYIHDRDIPLLESLESDAWQPRMSLLAPFDNLVNARQLTTKLFGFQYVLEQLLPKNKRKHGTYVLPILWGDRFIGRIDPQMDRRNEKLLINSIHAEPGAPRDKGISSKIAETIERLADFLGAKEVTYTDRVPMAWKDSLR